MPKKSRNLTKRPSPNLPPHHPDAVAMMADSMEWKTTARNFPLETYIAAITKMHARGYSFADIAKFLNEQLVSVLDRKKITRGQVYRVYQQSLELNDPFNVTSALTEISDVDAEAKAEIEDRKPSEPKEGKSHETGRK